MFFVSLSCVFAQHVQIQRWKVFFNYLKIVKIDWRSRVNKRNIVSHLCIKIEGPDIQEFAEKMYANTVTLC